MKTFKTVTTQKLTALVCDGCGLQVNDGEYEFYEFISVNHHCGYGSIHGDGKQIGIDLCQQCFSDMCGDALSATDKNNSVNENIENNESNPLEYKNIFDVICKSKAEASQLKDNADLRLATRELLSKNTITNKHELMVALKRVEQLWDAQYQSAEGNELHQLADLICAYEKKDWDSYFEEVPLADDDFMPERLNLKSKAVYDEATPAKGMLSSIHIKSNNDDETSRDSALAEGKLDNTKQYLIKTIIDVLEKHPELRLGQLIEKALNLPQLFPEMDYVDTPELFYVEDNVLADKLGLLLIR
jgi:hypothetical protein